MSDMTLFPLPVAILKLRESAADAGFPVDMIVETRLPQINDWHNDIYKHADPGSVTVTDDGIVTVTAAKHPKLGRCDHIACGYILDAGEGERTVAGTRATRNTDK